MLRSISLVLFLSCQALAFAQRSPSHPNPGSPQSQAEIGSFYLSIGRLDDAKTNCDAALKREPGNQTARKCLADVERRMRLSPRHFFMAYLPPWLRELLLAVVAIVVCWLVLNCLRWARANWRRTRFSKIGKAIKWRLLPLKETTDHPTGIPTMHFLDALTRIPLLLKFSLSPWKPHLLLLRPTPPEDYDPAIIDEFLCSADDRRITLVPHAGELGIAAVAEAQDVELSNSIQNLQFKIASGLDVGSLVKVLAGIVHWFNADAPTISGIVQATDQSVAIHVAAAGGPEQTISVMARTPYSEGMDAMQLSARRAAFKLLLRRAHPDWTDNRIDGYSALRQGASLFTQYAGTSRGIGDSAKTRRSALLQAASDFAAFRASVPVHAIVSRQAGSSQSIHLDADMRPSDLLAEGAARALAGAEEDLDGALACFRELQNWPVSIETARLRWQAAYNEAIVWRLKGGYSRTILMLTELLGDHPADVEQPASRRDSPLTPEFQSPDTPSICLPARLARLAAFAEYNADDWNTLPVNRASFLIDDGRRLISDLKSLSNLSENDRRVFRYLYLEAVRAIGHVEVFRVTHGASAAYLYDEQSHRPIYLKTKTLGASDRERLQEAIEWMKEAEAVLPTTAIYCDLAEAHLLLGQFTLASGYARHATLQEQPPERAFYLAAESCWLQDSGDSRILAGKYVAQCVNPRSPEMIALSKELQVLEESS